jgi:hypothetical protein
MTTRAERRHRRLEHEGRRVAGLLHSETGQLLALAHLILADVALDVDPAVAARLRRVRECLDAVEERLRRAACGIQEPRA